MAAQISGSDPGSLRQRFLADVRVVCAHGLAVVADERHDHGVRNACVFHERDGRVAQRVE